ncbi:helix-turn-helix transcriptional regulator [Streptomyces johnsoniae]|uniref:Helix-turn-helix transcriptional regulator n=1 Tax=Streptomyces johnsoniae TaxID=3075532 RepID=A0ABU2SAF2_9ACTN|nr:helix-turn-helix transcriptional regulator [Streptomyces sp. DSM 41886]MDT0444660.1 helix-turn-helix transcriptional regulator [Streptomyces sp. DSM 41886]
MPASGRRGCWRTSRRSGWLNTSALDRKTINRLEGGSSTLAVDQLLDIAEALGVSPRDLLPERVPDPSAS